MTEQTEQTQKRRILTIGIIAAVVIVLLAAGWLITRDNMRSLKPFRPTATPGGISLNNEAQSVTFEQLNANPATFRNQRIRVTNKFAPQPPPDCPNYRGPVILWALVSDTFQLNGLGFEQILQLVPPGTPLTVEGIWKRYEGPIGCSQNPGYGQVWYLQVERIVRPNPLPDFDITPPAENSTPEATPLPDGPTATPETGATAVPLPTNQFTPTAIRTGIPTATPTQTPPPPANGTGTATPSSTPEDGRPTSPPDGSATATATLPPGTFPATPTLPATGTGTPGTPPPPITSATPGPSPTPGGGYPGPGTPLPTSYP